MRVTARRFVVLGFAFATLAVGTSPARAAVPPSLRLIATTDHVTVEEGSRGRLPVDLGLWVAPVGGTFEVRMSRPDFATGPTAKQTTTSGMLLREIPLELLDTWFGFAGFLHLSIKDANGHAVVRTITSFCPNGWDVDRLDDTGPFEPTYPQTCWANPFILSTIWGIDEGWATNALQWLYLPAREFEVGTYQMRAWIDPDFVDLFDIAAEDAERLITIDVVPRTSARPRHEMPKASRLASVPEIVPTEDVVPDMAALPAWSIGIVERKRRDYLTFASTVSNHGPAPLLVEGYRDPGADVMDAWQYFTDASGQIVGKARAGQLEYDTRRGHNHWHFDQFTDYALMDATRTHEIMSEKQSFCLAPTDPIDLLAPRAEWSVEWGSECGEPGSLWVRETLPAGWGDTYYQWLPGQSFDVTGLPSGRYYIRVRVNPLGELWDRTDADDVSFRRVVLRGEVGGRRWVAVPPYQGVDSEGCWGCFGRAIQPPYDGVFRWPPA